MQPEYEDNTSWNIIIVIVVVAIIVLIFVILVCKCRKTIEFHKFQRGKNTTELVVITNSDQHNVILFSSKVRNQQLIIPSFNEDITDQKFCHHYLERTDITPSNSTYI